MNIQYSPDSDNIDVMIPSTVKLATKETERKDNTTRIKEQRRKDPFYLKKLLTKNKIEVLTQNFVRKLKRNIASRKAVDLEDDSIE